MILRSVWRSFRAWKRGEPVSDEIVSGGGVMSWLFGKTFRLISRSWQMYRSVSCLVSVLIPPPKSAYWYLCRRRVERDFRLVDYGLSGTVRQRYGAGGYA